jgi:NhaP-type Na+/H+ or K+/H+ antiporter
VLLVMTVGVALATHWDARAIPIALALFLVIRPLATQVLLVGTPTTVRERWLVGWFGIRGIGSLYYLAYAMGRGLSGPAATLATDLVISVVAISIVLHGASATPLVSWYERTLARQRE